MIEIAVPLDDAEGRKLSELAKEAGISEPELIRRTIEGVLLARRGQAVPRYARRLGPLVFSD